MTGRRYGSGGLWQIIFSKWNEKWNPREGVAGLMNFEKHFSWNPLRRGVAGYGPKLELSRSLKNTIVLPIFLLWRFTSVHAISECNVHLVHWRFTWRLGFGTERQHAHELCFFFQTRFHTQFWEEMIVENFSWERLQQKRAVFLYAGDETLPHRKVTHQRTYRWEAKKKTRMWKGKCYFFEDRPLHFFCCLHFANNWTTCSFLVQTYRFKQPKRYRPFWCWQIFWREESFKRRLKEEIL